MMGGIGVAFGLSFAGAVAILPRLPLRSDAYPQLRTMPAFAMPDDDSFFIASVGDELSQMVLYHDLGDSIAHARQADILIVGDSRAQMGLREDVIVPAARITRPARLLAGLWARRADALHVGGDPQTRSAAQGSRGGRRRAHLGR
jgi:hypothetical protein